MNYQRGELRNQPRGLGLMREPAHLKKEHPHECDFLTANSRFQFDLSIMQVQVQTGQMKMEKNNYGKNEN